MFISQKLRVKSRPETCLAGRPQSSSSRSLRRRGLRARMNIRRRFLSSTSKLIEFGFYGLAQHCSRGPEFVKLHSRHIRARCCFVRKLLSGVACCCCCCNQWWRWKEASMRGLPSSLLSQPPAKCCVRPTHAVCEICWQCENSLTRALNTGTAFYRQSCIPIMHASQSEVSRRSRCKTVFVELTINCTMVCELWLDVQWIIPHHPVWAIRPCNSTQRIWSKSINASLHYCSCNRSLVLMGSHNGDNV